METTQAIVKKSIVETIHEEFNQSFAEADDILQKYISNLEKQQVGKPDVTVNYSELAELFEKSSTVVNLSQISTKERNITREISTVNDLMAKLNDIRLKFPHKIISYSQIIKILEKYDLYIANSSFYTDILPEENAKHILNYKKSSEGKAITGHYLSSAPLCSQRVNLNRKPFHNSNTTPQFYVCAPIKMFSKKNRFVIGKELFYNEKMAAKFTYVKPTPMDDPIILSPLFLDNAIADDLKLFHIVTAWGPEAKDPLVFNQIQN